MLQDSVFAGAGPAMRIDVPPAKLSATNVLKVGAGEFLQFVDGSGFDWRFELRQFTLRQSGPLLRCWLRTDETPLSRLTLTADGCVFDLAVGKTASSSTASRSTLIAWMSKRLPTNWASAIEWQMSAVLVAPNIDVVTLIDPSNGRRRPIDETRLDIDGIVAAPFEFVGVVNSRSSDSQLKSFDAPLPSPTKVGVQADRLP